MVLYSLAQNSIQAWNVCYLVFGDAVAKSLRGRCWLASRRRLNCIAFVVAGRRRYHHNIITTIITVSASVFRIYPVCCTQHILNPSVHRFLVLRIDAPRMCVGEYVYLINWKWFFLWIVALLKIVVIIVIAIIIHMFYVCFWFHWIIPVQYTRSLRLAFLVFFWLVPLINSFLIYEFRRNELSWIFFYYYFSFAHFASDMKKILISKQTPFTGVFKSIFQRTSQTHM